MRRWIYIRMLRFYLYLVDESFEYKLAAGTLTEEELDDLRAERSWIIHELKSLA